MTQAHIDRPTEQTAGRLPAAEGIAMNAPDKGSTEPQTSSAEARRRAIAVIGAWACIGVAAIAAALFFLF
jgi:hypothetical protein